jgi:hypothetical protein
MAKQGGMGYAVSMDDGAAALQVISNDVTNFQFSTPRGVQDVTGVDKSAIERLLLLADFSVTLNGVHNNAANKQHAVMKTIPSSSIQRTLTLAVSSQSLSNECVFSDYAITRGQDGSLTYSTPGVLADGTIPTWS